MLTATGLPWLLLIVLTGSLVYARYRQVNAALSDNPEPAQVDRRARPYNNSCGK